MSEKMKIDVALANLEAGKFSFRMVDAIKDHISRVENELAVVHGLHASAILDLKRQELANWRHENELRRLNGQIYALLRANVLTEKAYAGISFAAVKMRPYFKVAMKFAAAPLAQVKADVKSGKLQSQCLDAAAKTYALLKAIMPTQRTLEEMKPYVSRMGERLAVFKKYVGAYVEKALAYLATLRKNAA